MRTLILALAMSCLLSSPALAAPEGRFERLAGEGGMLVAAPHGGYDRHSEQIAREVALQSGAGYLLALGFRTFEQPWNVNRPTAGVGLKAHEEARPPEAAAVYRAYLGHVLTAAPALYVEIHGNKRPESAGWIEVATQGLTPEEAAAFRGFFRARAAQLTDVPRFDMRIEPLDPIHYKASGAKAHGVFREVGRVLHLELPWAMRRDERVRSRYAWAIASALNDFRLSAGGTPTDGASPVPTAKNL
ncbi:MAG: hypothetical protein ACLGIN_08815 [Candidatus Sericytochromatia bacterium]